MRTARAVPTPWLCRKTMISRIAFCSAQAAVMRPARTGPMPSTSRRRSGSASMTSNTLSPEGAQELLGVDRANAADHSRGEVLLDTLSRGGRRGLEEPGFGLLAVGAVVDPVAGCRDPLACRHGRPGRPAPGDH